MGEVGAFSRACRRRMTGVTVAIVLAAFPAGASAQPAGSTLERGVEAAYLSKFPYYVTWPPSSFASPGSPLTICLIGRASLGPVLERIVSGRALDTHPVAILKSPTPEDERSCHMAYIDGGDPDLAESSLRLLARLPVLTVGFAGPLKDHATINFLIRDGRLRFDINTADAAARGLTISSKLLALSMPWPAEP